jgi:hypothetical protein
LSTAFSDLSTVATAFASAKAMGSPFGDLTTGGIENPISLPVSLLSNPLSFLHIGGGGSDQAKPYQTDHGIHPMYPIQGIAYALTPNQKSIMGQASSYNL